MGVEEGRTDGESTAPSPPSPTPAQASLPRHEQHCVSVSARLSVVRTTACSSQTKGKSILVDGVPMDRQVGACCPLGEVKDQDLWPLQSLWTVGLMV